MSARAVLRDRLRRARRGDEGMSLVELLVYSIILGIVMVLIGTLLINGLTTQRDVSGRTQAGNTMQVAFSTVERSVRNAGGGYVDAGGTLLVLRERTAGSVAAADQWRCVGYYFDESAGVLRRILASTGTETAAALAAPDASSVAGDWPEFVTGVSRIGTGPAFGPADGPLAKYSTVEVSLRASTGADTQPIELSTSVVLRPQSGNSLSCW